MGSKRAAILEAATQLFATKGYRETSATDVARLTGTAEATMFYHFESKEKLFLAILEQVRDNIDRAFCELLPSAGGATGMELLESVIRYYLQLVADNDAQFLLLHRHHAYDLAGENETCRLLLEAIYERFVSAFEQAIRRGQEDGSMVPLPVHKTALLVYLMVDGLVRLKHYNLYEPEALFEEVLDGCRRLVSRERGVG